MFRQLFCVWHYTNLSSSNNGLSKRFLMFYTYWCIFSWFNITKSCCVISKQKSWLPINKKLIVSVCKEIFLFLAKHCNIIRNKECFNWLYYNYIFDCLITQHHHRYHHLLLQHHHLLLLFQIVFEDQQNA